MKTIITAMLIIYAAGNATALPDIAIGAYGGLNIPIAQEDTKFGTLFGGRLKFAPTPLFGAAIFFESRVFGDPEITIFDGNPGLERTTRTDGGKVMAFGIEGILGAAGGGIGPHFYWFAGVGNYKWTRDNYEDVSKIAYYMGPGLEIVLPSGLGIEGRAKFEIVPTDDGASRKNGLISVGLNFHFGVI